MTESTEVVLDERAYRCWLRAGRPQPLAWFLGQPEDIQEALAGLGDEYLLHCAGLATEEPETEEDLLRSLLDPSTMGGIGERRAIRREAEAVAEDRGRSFLGRAPDRIRSTAPIVMEGSVGGPWSPVPVEPEVTDSVTLGNGGST